MKTALFAALSVLASALPAHAEWTLDNEASKLSFVSTKAGSAAEVHTFGAMEGEVDAEGNATISIDLETVDTAIEIRDQRMRDMLFETSAYPTATLAAVVDLAAVEGIPVGATDVVTAEGQLGLHGTSVSLTIDMTVARLDEDRVLAISRNPLVVNASQVGLLAGVEKLREIAGLPSISPAVPVTFVLAFEREGG
ncbi:MAG: YceI family protein [Pseudomonadota bacterium]